MRGRPRSDEEERGAESTPAWAHPATPRGRRSTPRVVPESETPCARPPAEDANDCCGSETGLKRPGSTIGFDSVRKEAPMKVRQATLVALVAAVAVTTVAAANSDAAKQRVAITTQANRTTTVSKAVLTPLQAGALKSDSGSLVGESQPSHKVVMRDGQIVEIYRSVGLVQGQAGAHRDAHPTGVHRGRKRISPCHRHLEGGARHRRLRGCHWRRAIWPRVARVERPLELAPRRLPH